MGDLHSGWATLAGVTRAADAAGRDLLRRWSEPHRHYHDTTHLAAVLDAVDILLADGAPVVDPSAVRFAAWFHDAVYDGVPEDDERASAALSRSVLTRLDQPTGRLHEVERLVLLTIDHAPDVDDRDGAILCDADLAILGADPATYADYVRRVRRDYSHVHDADFRTGRANVLRRLLARDPIYRTAPGQRRWADRARVNLRTELAELTVP